MKTKLVVIVAVILLVSCQSETEDSRLDWVQNIDRMVLEYDKNAQIEDSNTISEYGMETEISVYKENSEGVSKVEAKSKFDGELPIKLTMYSKNDEIILRQFSGLGPYLSKGPKREGDKFCELFGTNTYFKSRTEVILYKKHLDVMSLDEIEAKRVEFKALVFEETLKENPEEAFEDAMTATEELKNKIGN